MKRFVEFVPNRDNWGDRICVEDKINECARDNDLTIVMIAPTSNGVYVLFEKDGEL